MLPIVVQPPNGRNGLPASAGIRIGHYPIDTRPTRYRVARSKNDAVATLHATEDGRIGENSTVSGLPTNSSLGKEQLQILAQMAHMGLPRAALTTHRTTDGDTSLTIGTNEILDQVSLVLTGVLAANVTVCRVLFGTSIAGYLVALAFLGGVC